MDMHTSDQRKRNMQAVKSKDSKIEITLRLALFHKGYRYRKNYRRVFGCPDIVFTREKVAIFCDSEFWHGYDWENRKNDIKSHTSFWIPKIERNIQRDFEVTQHLNADGYIVLRFWGLQISKDLAGCCDVIEHAILERRAYK